MAFSDWDSYTGLLDNLAQAESNWSGASDFVEFDEKVRQNCPALVPNSGGYDELLAGLDETGDYSDKDELFEHLRIVIFAEVANVQELGEDWTGYWISKDSNDAQIYAESRSADASAWTVMDDVVATDEPVADDVEETEPAAETDAADPQEQQFDEASGRWRRWSADDEEFEYFQQDDGVWERVQDDLWLRYHDGAQEWLAYDGPSGTWLFESAWVAYEQVGAAATVETGEPEESDLVTPDDDEEDLDVLAARLVAETLAELEEEIEPLTDDERAEAIAQVRRELEKERAQ